MRAQHLNLDERFFLRIAVKNGLMRADALEDVLELSAELARLGNPKPIQALCLDKGLLTARHVDRIHAAQQATEGLRLDLLYAKAAVKLGLVGIEELKTIVGARNREDAGVPLGEYLLRMRVIGDSGHRRVLRSLKQRLSSGEHRYLSALNRKETVDTGLPDPRLLATHWDGQAPGGGTIVGGLASADPRAPAAAAASEVADPRLAIPGTPPPPPPLPEAAEGLGVPAIPEPPEIPEISESGLHRSKDARPARETTAHGRHGSTGAGADASAPRPRVKATVKDKLRPSPKGPLPQPGLSRRFPLVPEKPRRRAGKEAAAPATALDPEEEAFRRAVERAEAKGGGGKRALPAEERAREDGAQKKAKAAAGRERGLERAQERRTGKRHGRAAAERDDEVAGDISGVPLKRSIADWLGERAMKRESAEDEALLHSAVDELDALSDEEPEVARQQTLKAFQRRYKERRHGKAAVTGGRAAARGGAAEPPQGNLSQLVAVAWGLAAVAVIVTLIAFLVQVMGD